MTIHNFLYFVKQNRLYREAVSCGKPKLYRYLLVFLLVCPTLFVLFYRLLQNKIDSKKYEYDLGIVVIAKNESEYIQEWCAFHKVVGVDKIMLFDNESTDNMKELLQPFIDSGFVEYHYWKGRAQQLPAYNEGLRIGKDRFKYLAFIDCDEYLFYSGKNKSLKDAIDVFFQNNSFAGGLYVNWKMYGSNGLLTTPKGLCIEAFTKRALPGKPGTRCGKTILKTKCSGYYCYPHYPLYSWCFAGYDESGTLVPDWKNEITEYGDICLNHYFCKSKEQWVYRRTVVGDVAGVSEKDNRKIDEFYHHDNNDVEDISACYYAGKVGKILNEINEA